MLFFPIWFLFYFCAWRNTVLCTDPKAAVPLGHSALQEVLVSSGIARPLSAPGMLYNAAEVRSPA